jgi:DNA-binding transcriptional regulator YiaG
MDDLVRNGVLVNTVQGTDMTRQGTPCARATPPHTFILDSRLLCQLRHQRGLSQSDLADQAGISLTTVARLERQSRAPAAAGP